MIFNCINLTPNYWFGNCWRVHFEYYHSLKQFSFYLICVRFSNTYANNFKLQFEPWKWYISCLLCILYSHFIFETYSTAHSTSIRISRNILPFHDGCESYNRLIVIIFLFLYNRLLLLLIQKVLSLRINRNTN